MHLLTTYFFFEVPDQRATSKDGSLVWLDKSTNKYTTSNGGDQKNFAPVVTCKPLPTALHVSGGPTATTSLATHMGRPHLDKHITDLRNYQTTTHFVPTWHV